ncbi:MAG TPA: transglycosylase SLT domain-containing protein [Vicinamibacteria bacterium]|nr:transglycosylase SLT domain-containing protein [Vicinamibacteria bacterium]
MRSARISLALLVLLLGAAAPGSAQIYTRRNANGVIEATNVPDAPGFRLTYIGKGTLIHSRGFRGFYRGEYDAHILAAASVHGVATELIKAVIQVESEFDSWAVSSKGAQGLMQLMPFTARRFGVGDSFDPRQNIFGGVQYLRFLLDLFHGDVALALAGYNAGENAVLRFKGVPPFKETRNYVQKILGLLGGIGNLAGGLQRVGAQFYAAPARAPAPPARPAKITPARPATYYKWTDGNGVSHVAMAPPPEGVVYSMIRALH